MRSAREVPADATLAAVIRRVVPGALAAYVFGSAADGALHPGSDLDVAVLPARPLPAAARFDAQEAVAQAIGRDVDLVDVLSVPTVMRMQVVATGRVLFSDDDPAREAFEDYVFSAYARLNEERAGILERIAREGRVHDG